jgi:hypothetical protein
MKMYYLLINGVHEALVRVWNNISSVVVKIRGLGAGRSGKLSLFLEGEEIKLHTMSSSVHIDSCTIFQENGILATNYDTPPNPIFGLKESQSKLFLLTPVLQIEERSRASEPANQVKIWNRDSLKAISSFSTANHSKILDLEKLMQQTEERIKIFDIEFSSCFPATNQFKIWDQDSSVSSNVLQSSKSSDRPNTFQISMLQDNQNRVYAACLQQSSGSPIFTNLLYLLQNDRAQGGDSTFKQHSDASDFVIFEHPGATRSTFSHGGDPWEAKEDGPGNGAEPAKARPLQVPATNPCSSDWANPPCSTRFPELTNHYSTDVHRGFGPTRVEQIGNREGLRWPTEGDLRVDYSEAALHDRGEKSPALSDFSPLRLTASPPVSGQADRESEQWDQSQRHQIATSKSQIGHSPPLSKEWDNELTYGASHWRGENPQPRQGPRKGVPRLGDGIAGGDARGNFLREVANHEVSLADLQPSVVALATSTVTLGSNVGGPDEGNIPVIKPPFEASPARHQADEDSTLSNPTGTLTLKHPFFATTRLDEAPSVLPPRGTGLQTVASPDVKVNHPRIRHKSCMSSAGIPLGDTAGDFVEVKLDTSETSGRASSATSVAVTSVTIATGETSLSVGQSRLPLAQATDGETSRISVFPSNGRRPSASRGEARTNSIPLKADPGVDSPKSESMDGHDAEEQSVGPAFDKGSSEPASMRMGQLPLSLGAILSEPCTAAPSGRPHPEDACAQGAAPLSFDEEDSGETSLDGVPENRSGDSDRIPSAVLVGWTHTTLG